MALGGQQLQRTRSPAPQHGHSPQVRACANARPCPCTCTCSSSCSVRARAFSRPHSPLMVHGAGGHDGTWRAAAAAAAHGEPKAAACARALATGTCSCANARPCPCTCTCSSSCTARARACSRPHSPQLVVHGAGRHDDVWRAAAADGEPGAATRALAAAARRHDGVWCAAAATYGQPGAATRSAGALVARSAAPRALARCVLLRWLVVGGLTCGCHSGLRHPLHAHSCSHRFKSILSASLQLCLFIYGIGTRGSAHTQLFRSCAVALRARLSSLSVAHAHASPGTTWTRCVAPRSLWVCNGGR